MTLTALLLLALAAAPADPTSARMKTALDSVKSDSIKADVTFLASDEMGGRDTPSPGLLAAARFLRARLERLEWAPGAKDGYFYTYPLAQVALDEQRCALRWKEGSGGGEWKLGKEYFLASTRDLVALDVAERLVYAGSGSEQDLKTAGVEGRWAFVHEAGVDPQTIVRAAQNAKAAGVAFAAGPGYSGAAYPERFAPTMERLKLGRVSWPSERPARGGEQGGEEDPNGRRRRTPFPKVYLAPDAAGALLAHAKQPGQPALGETLAARFAEERTLKGGTPTIEVENVCGILKGSDPELAKQVILLSAHYDHVGTQNGVVHNGADDNGSGSSALLAVAEALSEHGPLPRTVMIMWVSGEEKGLWGSRAWSEKPWLPEGMELIADINIDMVGRNAPDQLLVTPTEARSKDYNGLVKLAEKLAPLEGFTQLGSADEYYTRSDHAMFAKLGIPVMFLFADVHEDYHRPGDDVEKLDCDKVRRVARLVLRVLDGLQEQRLALR